MGEQEALLRALPYRGFAEVGSWNAFPPSGTSYFGRSRVTWKTVLLRTAAVGAPGRHMCSEPLVALRARSTAVLLRGGDCDCGGHGAAPCVTVVVPFGDALTFVAKRESFRGALGGTSCREALSLRDALTFGARRGSSKGALSVTACLKTLSPAGMRSRFEHIYMRARGGNDSGETPAT
ncbi:hypothetical protein [Paenibacillus barengoltzii]|uniref:hypothetical protein n=2 Tax=Paenibacillus barengoltzii TaxID=343517 RepID=UPI002FD902A5